MVAASPRKRHRIKQAAEASPRLPDSRLSSDAMSPRTLVRTALVFSYVLWFALIAAGIAAYEGEPVRVKSRDLPLHLFDLTFRRLGALLLFALWALRAVAAWASPAAFPSIGAGFGSPGRAGLLYLGQACLRMVIYQLHVAGYIFTPKRWARDNLDHPPHVMSDHILLGSALMGGFACEAAFALLQLGGAQAGGRLFLKLYSGAATALAALVSCECYFTSRYFHPPREIMSATFLGLVTLQAPLLFITAREMQQQTAQEVQQQTAKEVEQRPAKETQ